MDETAPATSSPATATPDPATTPHAPQGIDIAARRAEIIATVRAGAAKEAAATTATTAPDPDAEADDEAGEPVKPAPGAPDPDEDATDTPEPVLPAATDAAARVAALEKELGAARAALDATKGLRPAPKTAAEALDLGFTIEELSEAFLKRQDEPEAVRARGETSEIRKEVDELKAELKRRDDEVAAEKQRLDAEKTVADGHAAVRRIAEADKARWPRITRDERNAAEAVDQAFIEARQVASAFTKQAKREPSEKEALKMVFDRLDAIEKDRADRAERYKLPDIPPARRTIAASTGSVGALREGAPAPKKLTREEILARVRRAQPKTS